MKTSIFQISNSKILRISVLKVYLKLNQKLVRITLITFEDTGLLKYANILKQIVLYLEIPFNFKTFKTEILQIFE